MRILSYKPMLAITFVTCNAYIAIITTGKISVHVHRYMCTDLTLPAVVHAAPTGSNLVVWWHVCASVHN